VYLTIFAAASCRTICAAFVSTSVGSSSVRTISSNHPTQPLFGAEIDHYDRRPKNANEIKPSRPTVKSKETSTFWFSDPERKPLLEEQIVPCEQNLDLDGPLPFGSYRSIGDAQYHTKRTCLLTAGLNFFHSRDKGEIDPEIAVANAQNLIDSGLTTFQLNLPPRSRATSPENVGSGMEPSSEQIWIEQNIYGKLVLETPPSVLSLCNLGTKISIPYWNFDGTIGNGAIIRQQVGESILNIFRNTGGCIDTIQVDYRAGQKPSSASPYTFDVLDVLFDMQREGLIRSINGVNFPVTALEELQQCGFHFDTNEVSCNLLNPNEFFEMQNFSRNSERDGRSMKVNMNRPLAGGLLTNRYFDLSDRHRTRNGEPSPQYMSPSEKLEVKRNLRTWRLNYNERERQNISRMNTWLSYEKKVMKTLHGISLKHRVDIASVALRWAMQQESIGTISVGTSLNTRLDEPFKLQQDLRKAFTLHLGEDDLEELLNVSGAKPTNRNDEFDQIDFSDKKLWL
jgi:aryl-alcohol dehydrogenase-like predicted oxidoreductase